MKINISLLKISILYIVLSSSLPSLKGNEETNRFAFSNIPKKLLVNANAVIRSHELFYTIENTSRSRVKTKYAITLLNENASNFRRVAIPYNDFISVSGIKATMYDSNGEIIFSAKPSIFEMSGNFGELASDDRYWVISFPLRKYPFTVEYEYEKIITESFFYESWGFQSQTDVAVQQSGAQYIVPKGMGFRVKELNLKNKCDTFSLPDKTVYTWQEENIPAYKKSEQLFLSFEKKAPALLTAPSDFTMGKIDGNMDTWQNFGKWNYELNKNRDVISPELQEKLKKMIANIPDKKEQVRRIYEFMQKNTRFASIKLGIGGYQTLEASFVEKKGFGDCKALSNYMKAMLKSVGITSYATKVKSGSDEEIESDFPSQQFNHIILCVPLQSDTVWLECTDQTQPFNFLGSFTDDRHVLLVTELGGKLVKTPEYGMDANFRKTKMEVSVDFLGSAKVNGSMLYSGLMYESPLEYLKEGKKVQEAWINEIFESPNIAINKLNFTEKVNIYPLVDIKCELQMRDFVSKTPKRMVFNPYLLSPIEYVPKSINDDFSISSSRAYTDSVLIKLPYGYKITQLPKNEKLETKFGSYQTGYAAQSDKLIYTRQLTINKGKFKKDDIEPFREFANKIAKLDRHLIVIEKE